MARLTVVSVLTTLACVIPASRLACQEPATLRGAVVDDASGAPLAGIAVTLKEVNRRSMTNEVGRFVFSGVPAGRYTVATTGVGRAPSVSPVTLSAGQTADIVLRLRAVALNLEEVVVTASKTETEVRDVPAAVQSLSGAQVEHSGATNFTEAIRQAGNVSVASFGENFQSVQLRGLPRLSNENETVLILVDGIPQTDARNSAQLMSMPIDNIDHVEVVKGPNSALYGRTAVGGVINIITKDPSTQPEVRARFQAGEFGTVRGEVTTSGPIGDGRSGYLVSWVGGRHDSFHVNPIKRQESSLFGKLTSWLDNVTQASLEVSYAINRGGTPTPVPLVNGQLLSDVDPTFPWNLNLNLPSAEYNEDHIRVYNKLSRSLGSNAVVTNNFGYRHSAWPFVDDGDFLSILTPGHDTVVLYPFTRQRGEDGYFDDLRLELTGGSSGFQHRLLVGASLDRNRGYVGTQLPYSDSASGGVLINYRNPAYPAPYTMKALDLPSRQYAGTFYAGYLQDEVTIAQRLRVTAGARYDYNTIWARPDTGGGTLISATFKKLSPKVGASYRLIENRDPAGAQLSGYAQYSRAFLPPATPGELTVALDPTNPLVPENITNYEIGLKGTFLRGLLSVESSVFDMTRDGIPVLLRVSGTLFRQTNAGEQRIKGVELGIAARPLAGLTLRSDMAYYDGKYGTFKYVDNSGKDVDLTGMRVLLSPQTMANVQANYEAPSGFGATLSLRHEGTKALDPNDTYFLHGYAVFDGGLSYRWRHYGLAATVTNLFDTRYATDGDDTDSPPAFLFPAPPRRFLFEVRTEF